MVVMSVHEQIFYKLLIVGVPILLTILAFIGGLAVNALMKMGKDLNRIKVTIEGMSKQHDGLEKRVSNLEHKING